MKKFLLTKVCPLNFALSSDDVQFFKDSNPYFGSLSLSSDSSSLSLFLEFDLSELRFSSKTIANENFVVVSSGATSSSSFEYAFDNDEMLVQFCEFYGIECEL